MKKFLMKAVSKLLKETAEKIELGNCEITDEQAMDIMSVLSHEVLSKDSACSYLNICRAKFDALVKEDKLPKGRKRRGFKELIWYKDELDECIKELRK